VAFPELAAYRPTSELLRTGARINDKLTTGSGECVYVGACDAVVQVAYIKTYRQYCPLGGAAIFATTIITVALRPGQAQKDPSATNTSPSRLPARSSDLKRTERLC